MFHHNQPLNLAVDVHHTPSGEYLLKNALPAPDQCTIV